MSSSGLSVVLAIILYLVGSAFGGNPGEPGPGVPVSGEVTASRATVRAGPGTSFPPVTVVEASTPVRITGRQGDWYRVELSGGLAGWM
ncbi:MAG TPA: SH3 domain-containing protein, partial [Limnochordales bacterium]